MGYRYRGDQPMTAEELLDMARAQAETIIAAAKLKAMQEARLIHELAYDQGLALAEREYARRDEREADRKLAKEAVLKRVAERRLKAAAFEVAGKLPKDAKATDRLENIEYLVNAGCTVDEALSRSGYHAVDSFKRAAYRHGRNDLVRFVSERQRT
ncbi:hypothetical protein [Arthrobacter sp. NicSoilC5]|uniref:hypothetical protein n=1 Tax=Arthrobacter sp. NicSoilC5 TaxID=2831000 RepID=UPI001CC59BD4|nr:hypothetical protein [Arthrobacter sp. NicSoilC5]BCW78987.1 hypothetical protein NicSoilC5_10060 [Arthrobacter sp. NicSoilC5]